MLRKLRSAVAQRLPLTFRILYSQFLLRVVDLEALSIEADIPRFLGQFAGILILIGGLRAVAVLYAAGLPGMNPAALQALAASTEQSYLAGTMLVAGLIAVVCWDNIFPDRRDVMVLGPLPVRPTAILAAKAAAAGAVLGIAILALNLPMGIVLPLILAGGFLHLPHDLAAWWFCVAGSAVFVYGSVLRVQGFTVLLLPRKLFLRLSAILQLSAFALCLGGWLMEPSIVTPPALNAAAQHGILAQWPVFWFFALFQQLTGRLPAPLHSLATRAWLALAIVLAGAAASLALCYLRTMKKAVEEPDLVPGRRSLHWTPRFGNPLQTAIVLFSLRSLARSKQHRVVYAFYLSVVFALAVILLRGAGPSGRPIDNGFLFSSLVMLCVAVVGLRSVFALPVTLRANWVLQITQLSPARHYRTASRRALLLMAVLPVWIVIALVGLTYRPHRQVAEHLAVLALVASILVDLSLITLSKIPFACSYLPGKLNVQYSFWALLVAFLPLFEFTEYEQPALPHPGQMAIFFAALVLAAAAAWLANRSRSRSATLYYEEQLPEIITTLGLSRMPLPEPSAAAQQPPL